MFKCNFTQIRGNRNSLKTLVILVTFFFFSILVAGGADEGHMLPIPEDLALRFRLEEKTFDVQPSRGVVWISLFPLSILL